jgi:hypothetical protein
MYRYTYVYIYIQRERERELSRDIQGGMQKRPVFVALHNLNPSPLRVFEGILADTGPVCEAFSCLHSSTALLSNGKAKESFLDCNRFSLASGCIIR